MPKGWARGLAPREFIEVHMFSESALLYLERHIHNFRHNWSSAWGKLTRAANTMVDRTSSVTLCEVTQEDVASGMYITIRLE